MKKEIILVRHGQTLFNLLDRVQGWSDTPLTEKGVRQAQSLGTSLAQQGVQFTGVFASDRARTLATARHILDKAGLGHHQVQPLEEFREFGFGEFEGQPNRQVIQAVMDFKGIANPDSFIADRKLFRQTITDAIHQMDSSGYAENQVAFSRRLQAGLDKVLAYLNRYSGNRALVVAHGVVIEQILMDLAPDLDLPMIDNGRATILSYQDDVWTVEAVNQIDLTSLG